MHKHTSFQQWKRKASQGNAHPALTKTVLSDCCYFLTTQKPAAYFLVTPHLSPVTVRHIQFVKCHIKGFLKILIQNQQDQLPWETSIARGMQWHHFRCYCRLGVTAAPPLCPQCPLLLAAKAISPCSKGQELTDYSPWQVLNSLWECNLDIVFATCYFQADAKAPRGMSLPLNTQGFLSATYFKFQSKHSCLTWYLGHHAEKDDNSFSTAGSDSGQSAKGTR